MVPIALDHVLGKFMSKAALLLGKLSKLITRALDLTCLITSLGVVHAARATAGTCTVPIA